MQWLTRFGRVRPELRATEYWQQGRSREIAWTKHLWPLLWRTSWYKLLSTTYTEAATFLSRYIWVSEKEMRSSRGPKGKEQPRFFDKTLRSVHARGHESRECSSESSSCDLPFQLRGQTEVCPPPNAARNSAGLNSCMVHKEDRKRWP